MPASAFASNGAISQEPITEAEPAATTTDSLEVATGAPSKQALTGAVTAAGTLLFGDASKGLPVLVEYVDYDCEYCRQHLLEQERWLNEHFVATERMVLERRFVAVTEAGKRMAHAALCAGDQGRFHEMDTYLLDVVPQSDKDILAGAKALKLNAKTFSACMQNDNRVSMLGEPDSPYPGIQRVPTFVIGNSSWEGVLDRIELLRAIEAALR